MHVHFSVTLMPRHVPFLNNVLRYKSYEPKVLFTFLNFITSELSNNFFSNYKIYENRLCKQEIKKQGYKEIVY